MPEIENKDLLCLPPGQIAPELKLLPVGQLINNLPNGEYTKPRRLTLRDFAAVVKGTKEYQERRGLTLQDPTKVIKINMGEHKGTTLDKFLKHCVVWEEREGWKEEREPIEGEFRILP